MSDGVRERGVGGWWEHGNGQKRWVPDDPSAEAPLHTERTIAEEWREILVCQKMLIDRVDALVRRAGCKTRRELMLRLGAK